MLTIPLLFDIWTQLEKLKSSNKQSTQVKGKPKNSEQKLSVF